MGLSSAGVARLMAAAQARSTRSIPRGAVVAALSCAVAFASGCASVPPLSTFEGVQWVLVRIGGDEAPSGMAVTVAFADGNVSGFSGCNRYVGAYHVGSTHGEVTFGLLASTRKMCAPAEMEIEARVLGGLQHVVAYAVADGELRLVSRRERSTVDLLFVRADVPEASSRSDATRTTHPPG